MEGRERSNEGRRKRGEGREMLNIVSILDKTFGDKLAMPVMNAEPHRSVMDKVLPRQCSDNFSGLVAVEGSGNVICGVYQVY